VTLLLGLAIRSSVLLAVGLVLSTCLAKRSAALRHLVLAAALLSAALVVPLSLALPEWSVSVPARIIDAGLSVTPALPPARVVHAVSAVAVAPQPRTPDAVFLIVVAWLVGVFVGAGQLLAGLVRVSRVAVRAARVEDRRWLQTLDTVADRYGLTRRIVISQTDSADLLATWGILRPQVLLPDHARDWTLDRAHVVLCHELAHIRRHDWLVQIGAETLRAILWFNPFAWMVCTRLRRESELACDDEVLGMNVGGGEYATHLLELARRCRRPGSTWASAMPMAHPSTLERRIAAMLNPRLDRQAPSRRAMAVLGVALLLVTLPVAALRARQAGPAPLSGTIYPEDPPAVPAERAAGSSPGAPQLHVANFCCPEYIEAVTERIRSNWNQQQGVAGQALVKFTVRRDGMLTSVEIAKTSGNPVLDMESRRAVMATGQVPPLPDQFSRRDLTVYLDFAYKQ
jgi:TonB family protein